MNLAFAAYLQPQNINMRLFSARHEYDYSWEEVSTNNWRKYCPWNDKAEHVIGVDVLNRVLDHETGIVSPKLHLLLPHHMCIC